MLRANPNCDSRLQESVDLQLNQWLAQLLECQTSNGWRFVCLVVAEHTFEVLRLGGTWLRGAENGFSKKVAVTSRWDWDDAACFRTVGFPRRAS